MDLSNIVHPLLEWYDSHGRTLPWRAGKDGSPDPYHVWVSEIMLQQTRVEAVKGYYSRFVESLPDISALAGCPEEELMKLWQGLGYYNRARNLKRAAQMIQNVYGGNFPEDYSQIQSLPGIGDYTAGAIASIAFGQAVPAVDGNVCRIITRLCCMDLDITSASAKRIIHQRLQGVVPSQCPGRFNQALMDLGATVCTPKGCPNCSECPLAEFCLAGQRGCWADYPVRKEKKKRRKEEYTILLLEYQGKYLIQKRPPKGLLASLWEFPSQQGLIAPAQIYRMYGGENALEGDIELLGTGKHIFSHVEWHMLGYLVHLKRLPSLENMQAAWASVEEMEERYSIPSAYSYYYQQLLERRKDGCSAHEG